MPRTTLSAAFALIALTAPAFGACASDAEVEGFVAAFLARAPAAALGKDATLDEARCTQAKLAAAMVPHLGPIVGYKAGLTNERAQAAFGVTEPVAGVLYRDMFLADGAKISAGFGARPLFEADLVLVVGDAAINAAGTPAEVMAHVSAVHAFIELPDLMYGADEPLTGATITAGGVGARSGVLGPAIAVEDPEAMAEALATMLVRVTDADGTVLSEAPGAAVLGHPANAVLWLRSTGITFKEGDLVSVGSIGPLMPPDKARGRAEVRYIGLPGDPAISVVFE